MNYIIQGINDYRDLNIFCYVVIICICREYANIISLMMGHKITFSDFVFNASDKSMDTLQKEHIYIDV